MKHATNLSTYPPRYTDSRDKSGEIIRVILPKMSSHPAALTPWAISVWYEHVAGQNKSLSQELNGLLDAGVKLDDKLINRLFIAHILADKVRRMEQEVANVIDELTDITARVSSETEGYATRTGEVASSLGDPMSEEALKALLTSASDDAQHLAQSVQDVNRELESSRQEIARLRAELVNAVDESMTDSLTGLLNRRGMTARAQEKLQSIKMGAQPVAVIVLDIDHFKRVNDMYGHMNGDAAIKSIADILRAQTKGRDIVARYGGEEFVVILPDTDLTGAGLVAERIRRDVESSPIRRCDGAGAIPAVTSSFGVALMDHRGLPAAIEQADGLLYRSKERGRNCVSVAGIAY